MTRVFITFRRQKNMQFRVSLLLMLTSKDKLRTAAVIFKLDENLFLCVCERDEKRPTSQPAFIYKSSREMKDQLLTGSFKKLVACPYPKWTTLEMEIKASKFAVVLGQHFLLYTKPS